MNDSRKHFNLALPQAVWDDVQYYRRNNPAPNGGILTFTGAALALIQRGFAQWLKEHEAKK